HRARVHSREPQTTCAGARGAGEGRAPARPPERLTGVEPRVILGEGRRGPLAASTIVVASICLLAFTVISNTRVSVTAPLIGALVTLVLGYRKLLTWRSLLSLTDLVVLFIPIRR